ncbi:MAG: hypothetical protein Q9191_003537 [Dirinaria sp. TL-2023a]
MDGVLPKLLSFPPHPPPPIPLSDADYDTQIKSVLQLLNETSARKLTAGVSGSGDLLDILDPSVNTLPYLYALLAHINGASSGKLAFGSANTALLPGGRLWEPMLTFMDRFDPIQIRYSGQEFRNLIAAVEKAARLAQMVNHSLPRRIEDLVDLFYGSHRSLYGRFDQQSYASTLPTRDFEAAKPVLDNDIFTFPTSSDKVAYNSLHPYPCSTHDSSSTFITYFSGLTDKLSYKDHLLYFLLGGMIYTGLKDWDRALHFYEIAIMAPIINAPSMIQVEAYKKRVLVGVLAEGRLLPMPKNTINNASKCYRALARAYEALAEVFQQSIANESDVSEVLKEAQAAHQIWIDDTNLGLVQQVLAAFRRFSILRLGKTYAALRIADVLRQTRTAPADSAETAAYLKSLIASGQLKASVTETGSDPGFWVLRFAEEMAEAPSETQIYEDFTNVQGRLKKLAAHLKESDRKLSLTREYLDWAKKMEKSAAVGAGADADDLAAADEDVMMDT